MARTKSAHYLTIYDIDRLGPICKAVDKPSAVKATVEVQSPPGQRFVFQAGQHRIAVSAVRAQEIADWPGLDDRSLFDLNVRHEVRPNRVRSELDRAIRRAADHQNFLAYHNGLTVVCDKLEVKPRKLVLTNISVVNGAQSAVAFKANENDLTSDLRVVVKFVEVGTASPLAREVGRRSNMQNPVNARNLRALDGRQLTIQEEFRTLFPDIAYETRPDYSNSSGASRVIPNDVAAQLLCAVYTQKPWLAVKRLSLFEGDNYTDVFNEVVTASHVVLVDLIQQRVQTGKELFPGLLGFEWVP